MTTINGMTERKRLRDIELLTQSIAHWKRMQADPKNCEEKPHSLYCALCKEYLHVRFLSCANCPIFEHTGKDNCRDTPWEKASDAWNELRDIAIASNFQAWDIAAQAEIDFLEMLKTKLEHQSPTP